jgi:hypothetical protein
MIPSKSSSIIFQLKTLKSFIPLTYNYYTTIYYVLSQLKFIKELTKIITRKNTNNKTTIFNYSIQTNWMSLFISYKTLHHKHNHQQFLIYHFRKESMKNIIFGTYIYRLCKTLECFISWVHQNWLWSRFKRILFMADNLSAYLVM